MHIKSPAGVFTIGAFLWSVFFVPTASAEFFTTRNQNPFSLFQGQPLPLPASAEQDDWQLQQSLDISNTLNTQTGTQQSLYADFESYYLNTRISKKLDADFVLLIDVPLVYRGGGIFDSAIDGWHKALGLPRADRPTVTNNQFAIRYIRNSITQLQLNDSTTGIGDVSVLLGYQLRRSATMDLRLWTGLELPTGDIDKLTGNDATDFSLTLAAESTPHPDWQFDLNLGIVLPGDDLIASNPTRRSVLYSYLASSWQATDWLQLRVQLESRQRYFRDSQLDLMDKANVLVFGGIVRFDRCSQINIGVSEDIDVGSSPDVSFLFSWKLGGGCVD